MIVGKRPSPRVLVRLGTINKWIKWSGIRMVVSWPDWDYPGGPTSIGFVWWGWGE